ncbi:MAG: PA2779 family protein [Woeseiaceae bacterium]|nr:PA2779 family protein [Woeseiaceae bacterium]
MFKDKTKRVMLHLVSIAILATGFAQPAFAGAIDTSYMLDADARSDSLHRIQALLAQESVAEQLQKLGVDANAIDARLQGMTTAELVTLEDRLGSDVAGGDALGVIGTVFLVLLILELVGVTDIFKSI